MDVHSALTQTVACVIGGVYVHIYRQNRGLKTAIMTHMYNNMMVIVNILPLLLLYTRQVILKTMSRFGILKPKSLYQSDRLFKEMSDEIKSDTQKKLK